ncbi:uncharacterized protein Dyak_GE27581 [Drosophila yakuba]|uniref:BPTI/Kunitz inhibitor domain-containing protein n=1 Tax=Drosophila yakuba TaxID=7245 RepID=A0A0R1DQK5_DROYA|nr:uncharacterized protein Dyak_GE27581 [Drosophila yakuba]
MWLLRTFVLLITLFGCGLGFPYPNQSVCDRRPKFWGNCRMHARGFTYVAFTRRCVPVIGICRGSENFFQSKASCESICKS